ncbi:hypothetical protein BJV78DRAFT_211135 [Lactifluus subvellereus]|nr:hypothetical protein BJV78DRAFT_211135 [Lactifluus subvellereus]
MSLDTSENAGPSVTSTLVSSSSSQDENKENKALAFRVYKEVWDEFNRWKVEDCKQHLLLLQKPLPPPEAAEATLRVASALRPGVPGDVEVVYLCDTGDDVPLDTGNATVLTCRTTPLKLPIDFAPYPRYESCTPSVQTVALRVGSAAHDEFDTAPFVPYADDPTFDAKVYLDQFRQFAWEGLANPDVEVIQFETLRRLHIGHGLSLDDIDATNVLPPLRETNRYGLIYQMTQRDELFWTGTLADFPASADGAEHRGIDPRAYEPDVDDLRQRIDSLVPYFCANPSCIQAFCPQHGQEFPPVPPAVARVASDDYPKGVSCGGMCYREMEEAFQEDSVQWGDPEIDELSCILEIIPDTVPCGLAKLVRKPCQEVFIQRRRLIPDDKIYPESDSTLTATQYRKWKGIEDYVPPDPCAHIGPCDQNNPECTCAKESVHCSTSCRCSTTCKRRWPGCRCLPKYSGERQTCNRSCPCRRASRECDPMVCECDNLTHLTKHRINRKQPRKLCPDGEHFCQNSDIQRGLAARLEIKRGAFGLGAFAVDRIRENQFIGEYVGELIPNYDDKRETLRGHVGLNYNFGINPSTNIDSARVGNETRYINHGREDTANARAETRLVFGEQRIGFFALRNIKPGEELRFDYGEHYWKST